MSPTAEPREFFVPAAASKSHFRLLYQRNLAAILCHELQDGLHDGHYCINPLNAKINPICHLLALLEARHILHVSRIRVNFCYSPNGLCHSLLHARYHPE
jgi:hypothetical protein